MRLQFTDLLFLLLLLTTTTATRINAQTSGPNPLVPEMILQFGHAGAIAKLVVSPDGRQLVSIGLDQTVRVWDIATGVLLRTMQEGSGETFRAAFFQQPDRPLVVGLTRQDVRIRDIASGQTTASWSAPSGTDANFGGVALSADHGTLALRARAAYAPITLYSTKTGAFVRSVDTWDVWGDGCLSLSADGSMLVLSGPSASKGDITAVWDIRSGSVKLLDPPIWNGSAHALLPACGEFTLDGMFVMAGRDGVVRFWDGHTGQLRQTFASTSVTFENSAINSCSHPCISAFAISGDGKWLAMGTDDGTLLLRDAVTGAELRRIQDFKGAIYAVAIGPAGKWVAYGGADYDIRLLDTGTGQSRLLSTNPDLVHAVACSVAANSCAFGSHEKRIRLWDLTTGRERVLTGHTSQVNAVAFTGDGRWLVSGSGDKSVKVWDAGSGAEVRTLTGHTRAVTSVAVAQDGRSVASGSVGGDVKLWDRESGKERHTLMGTTRVQKNDLPDGHRVLAVHFGEGGRELDVGYADGEVTAFDVVTGAVRHSFRGRMPDGNSSPEGAAWSPDDRWVALTYWGGRIGVWNTSDGALVRPLAQGSGLIPSAAFSPDGRWLATGSADTTVDLWDTRSWKPSMLRGHLGFVKSVAFGPDPRRLISGSGDGTVRIWDVASQRMMAVVASQKGGSPSVVVSPSGLFDGTAGSMQQVAWRIPDTLNVEPLDAFFTNFFRPGLFADLMAGSDPAPPLDFAAVSRVPGLGTLLTQKQAHIETRASRVLVCFTEPPRVAAEIPVTEERLRPRMVGGFRIDPLDKTCPYQKELPVTGSDAQSLATQLSNWKPEQISTAWDGKRSTDTAAATLHVLVVGVGEYPRESDLDRLPYAASSARAIDAFFRVQSKGRSSYAAVRVWEGLYDARATRDAIQRRLTEMSRVIRENDVVLLYFAGHGMVPPGQDMFYFVPVDGRATDLRGTGFSTAAFADGIRDLDARRVVLFIDACQSGGAVEPLSQIAAMKAQVEIRKDGGRPRSVEHGVGVHVIAATLPLSYAVQITQEQSALATTVLAALMQGDQITIGQVSSYLSQHLADASARVAAGFRQVPFINSVGLDFPIAGK